MKKRLLICSFNLEIGGVERSLVGLLNAIDCRQYDVDLFLYAHTGELMDHIPSAVNLLPEIKQYSYFQKSLKKILLERKGIPIAIAKSMAKLVTIANKNIRGIRGSYMTRSFKYSLPLLPRIEKEYDLAISFLAPHYYVLEKVNARKKVGWVHTDYSSLDTGVNVNFETPMWEMLDVVVAVSEDVKKTFVNTFPGIVGKVQVIENILSPEFVRSQSVEDVSNEMPEEYGVIKLCTVGRLSYEKGIDQAILACKILLARGCNIKWYIVGAGPDHFILRRMIKENALEERFIMLGKKVNPYPYIRTSDIYVLPSRYEGKSVTVREAQILGKPVLITNFTTAKSQLDDGVDGYITPLGAQGIAEGIEKMIDNPVWRDHLIKCALSRDYGNNSEVKKLYALL